jgi:hypothetical protein
MRGHFTTNTLSGIAFDHLLHERLTYRVEEICTPPAVLWLPHNTIALARENVP